ncbi:MAG: TetR/AcrR family transcriptional regulator C-terminal domain-containing protein [Acholeplasmataceae bacterium]|jgi:AcrR family transcriptional regulator|nr:TetR/AcrR family transcriptional regulator C-terminal domain-containing protein [Acholeplasmataceae bacterium]
MNQQKIDHRVRVTHTLLKEALYRLVETKPIQDITIKELCYEANINRTTFYAHFQSVKELIENIESEVWVELLILLKRSEKDMSYFNNQIFYDVYQIASKYHQLFLLLLNKNADPHFVEKVYNLGRNAFQTSFKRSKTAKDASKMEYYYISVLNSFIGILRLWLNNNMKESPEEMAEITKSIITRGIQFILENQK